MSETTKFAESVRRYAITSPSCTTSSVVQARNDAQDTTSYFGEVGSSDLVPQPGEGAKITVRSS